MNWQNTPYLLPLFLASVMVIGLAYYAWKKRPVVGAQSMIWLAAAVAVWAMGSVFELGNNELITKTFWVKVQYPGIVTVPLAWLSLALEFTGRKHWLTRWNLGFLVIIPLTTLVLLLVDDRLIWQHITLEVAGPLLAFAPSYGSWFWVHFGFSYILLMSGSILMLRYAFRSLAFYRGQAFAILLSAILPWLGNIIYITGLSVLDLTPFAFALSSLILTWGVLRNQLFNIVPIARERVVDSMTDGMIVLDKQSRIVDVNPTAERMIGQPLDQILSQPVSNIFADYAELFSRYRNKDELHDEIVIGEGRSCRTLDLRLSPLFDRHHQRQGTLVVLRDITERKQTETALQASEERFRHLTLNSPDMIYILNLPTYQTEFINKQEFLGYTLDELQQPGSILNQIHPDDLASATVFWQTLSEDKDNGKNTIEYQVRHKDGHWEWILNRVLVLSRTPAGAPEQLLVILTLITNSKQAEDKLRQHEERLRILVEQAPIGIVTVDMAGNVTDANPRSLELLGSPGKEATIGLNVLTLPSLISAGISPLLERVLTTGQMEEMETWYTSIWEKSDYLFIRAVPYSDGHRQQIGLIILVEDLTQRAQAEEGLRQMQKMESLSVLAGGIAHDFNNLLVAMMGQTSLALKKMLPENPGRPHVEKAVTAAEHAARLTQQLLAYSGRGQFETHLLQLNTLIEENNHLFQVTVSKNVQLQTKLTPSLPLIEADIGQIQQVVMNLIINAAEAIGEHSGTVTISTGTSEIKDGNKPLWRHAGPPLASGLYVTLSVRDNGGGMDEETLAKIFDPFFTTKFTGRGLGLAAVLGIVRGHKGGLQVDSQVGRGTTFKLYFPASVEQPIEESAPALASAAAGTQGCILVIDDEESVREAVSDILIGEGLEVITAANGEEGLALYVEHQAEIQLVLLDLSMPGLSGAETAVKLQQMNPDVLILLSSGYHQSEVAHKFTNLKVAGFLQKPYDATRLVKTIQRYLK